MMILSLRRTRSLALVCSIALAGAACDSPERSADSTGPDAPEAAPGPAPAAATSDGSVDVSAHAAAIHMMTAELVRLMDDVSRKNIMNPPLKVSDVRNAFMERLTWIDEMSAEDVARLRQATADLEALVAEIRAHENAAGDAALEARLKKIEDWNKSIQEGLPE